MTNIAVRKENDKPTTTTTPSTPMRWEPFRVMREMMNWDPFREMAPFVSQMPTGFSPSFEIKETKEAYVFKADVPGVKEGDLDVTMTGNRLTVTGKRESEKEEKGDTFYAFERTYGDFTRAFTLPDGADTKAVHAELKEGVLTVSIPKKPEVQPQKVNVQTPAKKS